MIDYRNHTEAIIDLDAYARNLSFFQNHCAPSKIMPIVKADGYGHGALPLSLLVQKMGFPFFGVAFFEEALELLNGGISTPVLVMNYTRPDCIPFAQEKKIRITLYAFEQWERIRPYLNPEPLFVHVKVDTGMSRLGQSPEETDRFLRLLFQEKGVRIEGIFTHYATADQPENPFQKKQYDRFSELFEEWRDKIPFIHMDNSAAGFHRRTPLGDLVRCGIASYGLDPSNEKRGSDLQPVLSWHSLISFVKDIKPGTPVSYGNTFISNRTMRAATVPIGYADGYNRLLSNNSQVLVDGQRCSVIGRVCMDQIIIDVSHIPQAKMGDPVVLIGKMGQDEISAEEIAQKIRTINYEVTCSISKRVPRVYKEKAE